MKTYFRILRYARPVGWMIPQYLLLTILATIFSVVNFTILIPLLRVLFDQSTAEVILPKPEFTLSIEYFKNLFNYYLFDLINQKGKLQALYYICGIALSSVFLANLFRFLSQLIIAQLRIRVIRNLRSEIFRKLFEFDLQYFIKKKKGDLVSRMTLDVAEMEQSVISTLKAVIKEPLLIIGYFIALFSLSVELTLYSLLIIPVSGVIISTLTKYLKRSAKSSQESLGAMGSFLDETLGAMRIFKAFNAISYATRKFKAELNNYADHTYRMILRSSLAPPVSEFLGITVLSLVLLIGGSLVLRQESSLDAAEFIGFLVIFSQVLNPAKAMSAAFGTISRGMASADRVFELADTRPDIKENQNAKVFNQFSHSIELKDVSFAYDNDLVLKNINLTIPKGNSLAIVGPSGGGKTTILDLIMRFYDPQSGTINIDEVSLKDISLKDYRSLIGFVTQDTILFHDTVARNIAFGNDNASMDEVIRAAKSAHAHEFIKALDQGYETVIGERGEKLSGGQRQRISIARAILKNPPILILDEATSSLDIESERKVQEAINQLMKNRTTIIVTHRLSTIQNADRIAVLSNGEIIETGTHEQLILQQGLYKKFAALHTF